ncbi:hypothetical protein AB1Y20_014422 [Prymnesium parvum]|uniref:FAD/NAD(P)-binding domain-containing protein n=1 Tax=Prymnesium parvum TaxID=97485 RepID=A0AB34IG89_PRYPA
MLALLQLASAARAPLRSALAALSPSAALPLPRSRARLAASPPPAASSLDAAEIVVVGGGFGGLYTSLRLAALEWRDAPPPRVTLVDRSEHFTFLPMLYELVTGAAAAWEVSPRFSDLLASSSISFVHAEVTALDRHARLLSIQPRDGAARQLPFDACVLALGSEPAPPPVSGGALALPFYTREHALALRQTLQSRWPKPGAPPLRVVVVGGGYIGVELSANLARWGRSDRAEGSAALAVSLVHRSDSLLDASKPYSRKAAVSRLSRLGVHSVLDTSVEAMSEDAVALRPAAGGAEGYSLGADVVLWAAGSRPNRLLASLGLPLDSRGRVCTDRFLRVSSLDGTLRLHLVHLPSNHTLHPPTLLLVHLPSNHTLHPPTLLLVHLPSNHTLLLVHLPSNHTLLLIHLPSNHTLLLVHLPSPSNHTLLLIHLPSNHTLLLVHLPSNHTLHPPTLLLVHLPSNHTLPLVHLPSNHTLLLIHLPSNHTLLLVHLPSPSNHTLLLIHLPSNHTLLLVHLPSNHILLLVYLPSNHTLLLVHLPSIRHLLSQRPHRLQTTHRSSFTQADYVAWNLRASMLGDKLLPFRFQDLGEMISLGEDAASVSALGLVELDGPLAAVSRRAVYAARMPTASQAASVGASWAVDSAVQMLRNALKKAGAQKQSKP